MLEHMTVEETLDLITGRLKHHGQPILVCIVEGGNFGEYAKARATPPGKLPKPHTLITCSLPDRDLYYLPLWDIEFNVPHRGKPGVTGDKVKIADFLGTEARPH